MPAAAFADHLAVLDLLLDHRPQIAAAIERAVLNAREREAVRGRDRHYLDRRLTGAIYGLPHFPATLTALKGRLAEAHFEDGFVPVVVDGFVHELDPVALVARAYVHWDRHRWPGHSARVAYAAAVLAAFIVRELEHLSLRIWDGDPALADARLGEIQARLDRLGADRHSPRLIREAAWLIQTAQGALTTQLAPYFAVARRIAGLPDGSRLAVHAAGAKLAGGHLRSQLRYRSEAIEKDIDHPDTVAVQRNSNSMDTALLLWDLMPLLRRYAELRHAAPEERLPVADAILQGLSADPELLLLRFDLLRPSTMLETLFVDTAGGSPALTPLGSTHLELLDEYTTLAAAHADALAADARACDPAVRPYSPYNISYGFVADMLTNAAIAPLTSRLASPVTLEDMFDSFGNHDTALGRANEWIALPRQAAERDHFQHDLSWGARMFAALESALHARVRHGRTPNASTAATRRLSMAGGGSSEAPGAAARAHCLTTSPQLAAATGMTFWPEKQLLSDRHEARFLASTQQAAHWVAVSKVLLTLCLSQGQDAVIPEMPEEVRAVLRVTCGEVFAE